MLSIEQTAIDRNPNNNEYRLHISDLKSKIIYLIDSGSAISVNPGKNNNSSKNSTSFQLTAANGSIIKAYGLKVLTLHLGLRRDFKLTFVVTDVETSIIGTDFVAHFGLLIDLRGRKLIDTLTNITTSGNILKTNVHCLFIVNSDPSIAEPILKLLMNFPKSRKLIRGQT